LRARSLRLLTFLAALFLLLACQKSGPPSRDPWNEGTAKAKAAPSASATPKKRPATDAADLAAARELDQQGVRAFTDGRYRQPITFFEEARKRGGPASELWNIVRCYQHLDDAEGATETLTRYLDEPRLTAAERDEGKRELAELQKRPSRVVVLSDPPGAAVFVDDRKAGAVGRTPLTLDLSAGKHTLHLELAGHPAQSERITAHLGQPVIVDVAFP
jgi:hypothetical protein